MGSNLGRMLAITLPLAGIGIAAPFLAPALLGPAAATAATTGAATGAAGAGVGAGAAAPAAATPAVAAAGGAGAAGGSIAPATLATGIQGGTSLASGLLNQAFNQPGMPQMPTIRAPAQSAAPYFSANDLPSPTTGGLSTFTPGPGPMAYQGAGVAGDLGNQVAANLFSDQNPFAQYAQAA